MEASPTAAGLSWVPLQPWTLGIDTEDSWALERGGLAVGLSGTQKGWEWPMPWGVSQEGECDVIQGLCHIISLFTGH